MFHFFSKTCELLSDSFCCYDKEKKRSTHSLNLLVQLCVRHTYNAQHFKSKLSFRSQFPWILSQRHNLCNLCSFLLCFIYFLHGTFYTLNHSNHVTLAYILINLVLSSRLHRATRLITSKLGSCLERKVHVRGAHLCKLHLKGKKKGNPKKIAQLD